MIYMDVFEPELIYYQSIFGLFLKYTSVVGNRALSSSANFMNEFHQIVSEPSDEAVIIETLETLQEMVIGKFHASTQAYFQYLSLGIHTVRIHVSKVHNTNGDIF